MFNSLETSIFLAIHLSFSSLNTDMVNPPKRQGVTLSGWPSIFIAFSFKSSNENLLPIKWFPIKSPVHRSASLLPNTLEKGISFSLKIFIFEISNSGHTAWIPVMIRLSLIFIDS